MCDHCSNPDKPLQPQATSDPKDNLMAENWTFYLQLLEIRNDRMVQDAISELQQPRLLLRHVPLGAYLVHL